MKNLKHFFLLFLLRNLEGKKTCYVYLLLGCYKFENWTRSRWQQRCIWKKKIICCRFSNKESATKAICGVNGTVIGENMVKCSWGKESNDPNQSGGGAGSPSQMVGHVTCSYVCMDHFVCTISLLSNNCNVQCLWAQNWKLIGHWLNNCQVPS